MIKYKALWGEAHDPYNWNDEGDYEKGKQLILNLLPVKSYTVAEDGWLDLVCEEQFVATTAEKAYAYFQDKHGDIEVFSIYDDKDILVATEEGLEDELYCKYCKTTFKAGEGHSCWEQRSGLIRG